MRWLDDPSRDFRLGDLLDFVACAPEDSALYMALHPDSHRWGVAEQLLAGIADFLAVSRWLDAGKRGRKPKPIPRPGVVDKETRKIGGGKRTMSKAKIDEWLAKRRRGK